MQWVCICSTDDHQCHCMYTQWKLQVVDTVNCELSITEWCPLFRSSIDRKIVH
jgi:hypothetical protein